jgi:hypothetical protein
MSAGINAFVDDDEAPDAELPPVAEFETLADGEEVGVDDALGETVACGVGETVAVGVGCTVGTGVVAGTPGFGVAGGLPPCDAVYVIGVLNTMVPTKSPRLLLLSNVRHVTTTVYLPVYVTGGYGMPARSRKV